jgi:hypothetical protein
MPMTVYALILAFAGAQSLAELAKKEKERRKAADETEAVEAYTDEDLPEDQDGGEAAPQKLEKPALDREKKVDSGLEEWQGRKDSDKTAWRKRFAEYRARFAEQKERLATLRRSKEQCDSDQMPVGVVDAMSAENGDVSWGLGPEGCAALPGRIAETEKAMRALQTECASEARQRSIPPSEARLQ